MGSTIHGAVETLTQSPRPSSTNCWWLTAQAGPSRAADARSANELLRALIGKDPIEGSINTGVKLLPQFQMRATVPGPRMAGASKNAGLFRFLHRTVFPMVSFAIIGKKRPNIPMT